MNEQVKPQPFDAERVRADFPILNQEVNGHPLVYLDNAATTQKPRAVIQALVDYYEHDNSNVHRGAHALADRATQKFEAARVKVAEFINAPEARQVIWTRGTTEGINLVASSWGRSNLKAGDRVLVSAMEHHSNIVPWQMVAAEKGATVEAIPVDADGVLDLAALQGMLDERVKMVACGHVSNALGTVNPVEQVIRLAHGVGALTLIDGAQAVSHWPVDMQALDCDFYVFSAHKLFGPTGLGALYGKVALLEAMPPYQGGGEMIESVSFAGTTYNQLPYKFEAGTPDIAGVIAFGAAIDYLNQLDRAGAAAHEKALLAYADHVVVTDEQDLARTVMEITGGQGANVVYDPVGGPFLAAIMEAAAPEARIIEYGILAPDDAQFAALFPLLKRLNVKPHSTMKTQNTLIAPKPPKKS